MTATKTFDSSAGKKSSYIVETTANLDDLEIDVSNADSVSIFTPVTYADTIEWQVSALDSPGAGDWQTITDNTGTNIFDAPAAEATLLHGLGTFKRLRMLHTTGANTIVFNLGFLRA